MRPTVWANDMAVTQAETDLYQPNERIRMANKKEDAMKKYEGQYEEHLKYWRSWGSWFSWGSPVGLGLFFISLAFTIWLLGQTFGWGK